MLSLAPPMIPSVAHFLWVGRSMPYAHAISARTAVARAGLDRVVLHHVDPLEGSAWRSMLERTAGLELRRLAAEPLLESAQGPRLVDVYRRLTQPASRVNVLRAAVLATEGGVYLDTDTVTVRELHSLLDAKAFCGEESIVFPRVVMRSRDPRVLALAGVRHAVRDVLRRTPGGWRAFRAIGRWYPRAVNNAVLGTAAGGEFIRELLARMVALPPERQLVRFALGTHLLQELVEDRRGSAEIVVHPPETFYPLAPEISEHWVRRVYGGGDAAREMCTRETRIVHWYASVRTKRFVGELSPRYVRANAQHVPICWLLREVLGDALE